MKRVLSILMLATAAVRSAAALELGLSEAGVTIRDGKIGEFRIAPPQLRQNYRDQDPVSVSSSTTRTEFRYPGDCSIVMTRAGNTLKISFRNPPPASQYKLTMRIPSAYIAGGRWQVGEKSGGFRAEHLWGKPEIAQGCARKFRLTTPAGITLDFQCPAEWSYHSIYDLREKKENGFTWNMLNTIDQKEHSLTVALTDPSPAAKSSPAAEKLDTARNLRVDRFGQPVNKQYPGKITDERELLADRAAEKAYYDSFTPLATDRFGGLPGSGARFNLRKTGFYHVEQHGGRWYLVNPEGNLFFHLGVCLMGTPGNHTYIPGREQLFQWLPPRTGKFAGAWHPEKYWNDKAFAFYDANIIRKYGRFDMDEWRRRMTARVKAFGFNSAGSFSWPVKEFKKLEFPYVASVYSWEMGVPTLKGVSGVLDPYDPETVRKLDLGMAKVLTPEADNPWIIGYFLANEQGWQNLAKTVPTYDSSVACKRELVAMLQKKYGDIAAFNRAWAADSRSFSELADLPLQLKTRAAYADMNQFCEQFIEACFKLTVETFRKYDRNHLLLGNRWQPGTANDETLCRIAGKYLDVVSINYYAPGIDREFIRRIYDWTGGKPQIWSEFYYTSEREAGPRSFIYDLPTQRERGLAYRNYLEGAASLGFVVGVEWFTLIDQALTGRHFEKLAAESYNCGLFDVTDRPYKDMIAEMARSNRRVYEVWTGALPPYQFRHPLFLASAERRHNVIEAGLATAPIRLDGTDNGYPTRPPVAIPASRLVIGAGGTGIEGSMKSCWDKQNLYLILQIRDATPMKNGYSGKSIWYGDSVELFFAPENPDQEGPLQFNDRQYLISSAASGKVFVPALGNDGGLSSTVVPAADGRGYTMEVALPWKTLGVASPQEGMRFRFDVAINDSLDGRIRQAQLMWNGSFRNSSDRTGWGILKLER